MTDSIPTPPRLTRDLGFFLPPLALVLGVFSGFYLQAPTLAVLVLAPLAAVLAGFTRLHRGAALILIIAASALIGNGLCRTACSQHLAQLPSAEAVGKSFKIRCRVRNQYPTRYGSALAVDRIRILSPVDTPFKLDRLTLYLPQMDGAFPRNREIETWFSLGRTHPTQPFPHPMAQLRNTFYPRYHGNVKDLRLIDTAPERAPPPLLNQGNRQLVALFLDGAPSHLWRERLAPFGLGHLLAISGLHCVLIYFLLQLLLLPLRRPLLRTLITVAGILAFAHWVGWTTSVTRASIMLVLWQLLPNLNRPRSWFRLWGALLVIAVVSDPPVLLLRGFWYSFAASLGLILGNRQAADDPLIHPLQKRLRLVLPIIAAQLFVLPINLMFDCHTGLTGFFWNLLGAGFLAVLLLLLALSLLALAAPPFAAFANLSERLVSTAMTACAHLDPGFELIRFPYHPAVVLALLIALFLCLRYAPRERRWYAAGAFLILTLAFHRPLKGPGLIMFDVGQGACALHVDKRGEGFLFDAGGRLPGGVTLTHLTRLYGAKQLQGAVVSHFNEDHYNLLEDIPPTFPLIVPPRQASHFRNHPYLSRFPIRTGSKGDQLTLNQAAVNLLWPDHKIQPPNDNEDSIVALLEEPHRRTLFTGDAGHFTESHLSLSKDPRPTVLQAGHHGSKTATGQRFLQALQPDLVLISCGRDNRFNHPHPEVMQTLQRGDYPTLITAQEGSINLAAQAPIQTLAPQTSP